MDFVYNMVGGYGLAVLAIVVIFLVVFFNVYHWQKNRRRTLNGLPVEEFNGMKKGR